MGNRKIRVSAWERELSQKVFDESTKWRHEIWETAGFKNLPYGGGSTMTPSAELAKLIDQGDATNAVKVDSSQLGPGIGKLLDIWDHEYPSQPINKSQTAVESEIAYNFILPDGTQLEPEFRNLGQRSFFIHTYGKSKLAEQVSLPIVFKSFGWILRTRRLFSERFRPGVLRKWKLD
jgi:hypothetical protein